mgnify:CR=1 FL=1
MVEAVAVAFSIAWRELEVEGGVQDHAPGVLAAFRAGLYRCFTKRPDALFELAEGDRVAVHVAQEGQVGVGRRRGVHELRVGHHVAGVAEEGEALSPAGGRVEVRIVDPGTLEDLPTGEHGEIWLRTPQLMKGFLGKPEETAKVVTEDGWFRTGDLGMLDENGGRDQGIVRHLVEVALRSTAPGQLRYPHAVIFIGPSAAVRAVVR